MKIQLSDLGKRFNREWIFRHLNFDLEEGNQYAITGSNGSGKSTLLQIIAGSLSHTEGQVRFFTQLNELAPEYHYKYVSLTAPYLSLPNEMTLHEFFHFHFRLKPIIDGLTINEVMTLIELKKEADKQMRYFSSGMMQRVKLAQSIFSKTQILLLDEPCTNLDEAGISLYHSLIQKYASDRLVIVSSNDPQEYSFCHAQIPISRYKDV